MKPKVSVIIPTYFRNDLLEECIESVVNQTYDNIEIIVVDDSGEKNAEPVVSQYNVKYIPLNENSGPNIARNTGLEYASGKYIQLLDDDDLIKSRKIQQQIKLLESHEEAGVAYCGYEQEGGKNVLPDKIDKKNILQEALKLRLGTCITSTMLVESQLFYEIMPLPDTSGSDDTFWKIEFAKRTEFVNIKEALVIKGEPENSRMKNIGAIEGTWEVIDRYEGLYTELGQDVLHIAIAEAERREAMYLIQQNIWSTRAVYLFIHALYIDPEPNLRSYLLTVSSPTGLFGMRAGKKLYNIISNQNYT